MYKYRRVIISVIAGVLVLTMLAGIIAMLASAKTSDEIQAEINDLEAQSENLAAQREQLEYEIQENQNKTLTIVEEKSQVDRDIELTRQEVELVKEQIHQYSLLIAEKQAELDVLEAQQEELFERYKRRMRAMQERGDVSYWSVIFEADSFVDMLSCRTMIEEIAKTDQRMMDEMRAVAAEVMAAKNGLAEQKTSLEQKRAELAEAEERLASKRQESEDLLNELLADKARLIEETEMYEQAEAELAAQIAALEVERTAALLAEWQAAHPPQPAPTESTTENTGDQTETTEPEGGDNGNTETETEPEPNLPPSASENFMFPLPAGIGVVITSPYGYRVHPITGNYTLHNGVDLAISSGTPIYASKSGVVTTATNHYSYGNYVTINHMDGYSTLYAHMTYFVVSEGDYVDQGQVIGYVGSTGYSTGPHLHFTIFCNGSTENPMNYISLR